MLRFASSDFVCFDKESLGVDVGKNVAHFLKMAICDHSVCFIKYKQVDKRQGVHEIWVFLIIHELPQSAWGRDNDSRFIAEKSLLFLDGHTSDYGGNFDGFLVLDRDHSLDHVFDLDGKFSCRTQD